MRVKICGIYCIENIINNKKYIGKSIDIDRRFYLHKRDLNKFHKHSSEHFQNAWTKYGEENFKFYILEECLFEELNDREIYYIWFYNSVDKNFGYNILSGGNEPPNFSGKKHSEETKEKMSSSAIGNQRWLGRKHSEETKKRMSLSSVGLKKKNQSSKYMGVSFAKRNKMWACNITYNGKLIWIGYFKDEISAAKAYDKKAVELYGETAKLNFPNDNNNG